MLEQRPLTARNWESVTSEGICVVKMGADWCSPCRMYDESIEKLINEFSGQVAFFKIDIDQEENRGTAQSLQMKQTLKMRGGVPHVAILRDGELQGTVVGLSLEMVRQEIEAALAKIA